MAQLGEGKVNAIWCSSSYSRDIVGFQEGVIDMWEKVQMDTISKTYNLVIDITPVEGLIHILIGYC